MERVFKPRGVPLPGLGKVALTLDGLEALRLADLEGLYHEEAADRMGVSRPTFARILAAARREVADALVNGKAIRIGGGAVVLHSPGTWPCPLHGGRRRRGRGCRCPHARGEVARSPSPDSEDEQTEARPTTEPGTEKEEPQCQDSIGKDPRAMALVRGALKAAAGGGPPTAMRGRCGANRTRTRRR